MIVNLTFYGSDTRQSSGCNAPRFNVVILSGANKDLPRNGQDRLIDQSLLSAEEMVRRAPGWARRVLTMTGFLVRGWDTEFGTVSVP